MLLLQRASEIPDSRMWEGTNAKSVYGILKYRCRFAISVLQLKAYYTILAYFGLSLSEFISITE